MSGLSGKVALVTGAAGGIGFATSQRLARDGADVAMADLNAAAVSRAAETVAAETGVRTLAIELDVSSRRQVLSMAETIETELGPVNVLVNAAGILESGSILEISEEQWDRMLAVNLKGPFLVTQAVLEGMIESGYGRIINLSSVAGKKGGMQSGTHYGASKGGVLAMTKNIARYLAQFKMTANCVCPSITDTGMAGQFSDEVLQILIDDNPFKRLARPEEVANAISFLASEDAGFVSAEMLDVDGGYMAD